MTTKRKPAIREQDFTCTEKETIGSLHERINTLSILMTGNGDPEKGLCRKVAIIRERQDGVLKKLDDIQTSLVNYHNETEEAKGIAATSQSALEKYKLEQKSYEEGIKDKETRDTIAENLKIQKARDSWQRIIWIIMALIGLYGIYHMNKQSANNGTQIESVNKKIDNFGTPVIINSRGAPTQLPIGDSLKYFRDGHFKDTMK